MAMKWIYLFMHFFMHVVALTLACLLFTWFYLFSQKKIVKQSIVYENLWSANYNYTQPLALLLLNTWHRISVVVLLQSSQFSNFDSNFNIKCNAKYEFLLLNWIRLQQIERKVVTKTVFWIKVDHKVDVLNLNGL